MKKFFGLLALILLMNFSVVNAAQLQPVTDQVGLMKATEIELLNQKIRTVEQMYKIKIGVVFVKSIGGRDPVAVSDDLLQKNFANGTNGGILLFVDMSKRHYEIATDKRMVERITNTDGISLLQKKFQSSLSAGNYYGAVNDFVGGVEELMTYYETKGVAYGQKVPGAFNPEAAGIAVVVAIFIGVFVRSMLIGSMSNIHHAMEAIDYLKKNSVKLTEARDTFLFMNVQRRPKGGGGGRSSSGGGGHSGGGGGGSF